MESLSSYARQFLGQMDKPDVDYIEGLSPAISIDQKTTSRNPRSTVGTVNRNLRLFAPVVCPGRSSALPGMRQTHRPANSAANGGCVAGPGRGHPSDSFGAGDRGKKGEHLKVMEDIRKDGYVRVRVDGDIRELGEEIKLDKKRKHTIEAVIDRIVVKEGIGSRLADSLEAALKLGEGLVTVDVNGEREQTFSENFACIDCGISLPEISPRMFSFNTPYGACPACTGLGVNLEIDREMVVPDGSKTFAEGAITTLSSNPGSFFMCQLRSLLEKRGYSLDVRWIDLPEEIRDLILNGSEGERLSFEYEDLFGEVKTHFTSFEGVLPLLTRRHRESTADSMREEIERYMTSKPCPVCQGYPPEKRNAGREDRREKYLRVHAPDSGRKPGVFSESGIDGQGESHRVSDPQGDRRPAGISRQSGPGLSVTRPGGRDSVGRRSAAHPARDSDRLGSRRRPLHLG